MIGPRWGVSLRVVGEEFALRDWYPHDEDAPPWLPRVDDEVAVAGVAFRVVAVRWDYDRHEVTVEVEEGALPPPPPTGTFDPGDPPGV